MNGANLTMVHNCALNQRGLFEELSNSPLKSLQPLQKSWLFTLLTLLFSLCYLFSHPLISSSDLPIIYLVFSSTSNESYNSFPGHLFQHSGDNYSLFSERSNWKWIVFIYELNGNIEEMSRQQNNGRLGSWKVFLKVMKSVQEIINILISTNAAHG